jgi:chemotaxis protein CheD
MAPGTVRPKVKKTAVGMGQIGMAQRPACLTAVLGSCIGVALYHRKLQLGMLGHVVLPCSSGQTANPGKFADTAVPYMLRLFATRQVAPADLVAKIVGGASMFDRIGPLKIGEANRRAIIENLEGAGIRIVGKDVGGTKGRRISFDCASGLLTVETVGSPPKCF